MPKINENLDPSLWTTAEQQAMYDALVVLLGISPTVDLTVMTDAELAAHINTAVDEVATRPSTVPKAYTQYTLAGTTLFRET